MKRHRHHGARKLLRAVRGAALAVLLALCAGVVGMIVPAPAGAGGTAPHDPCDTANPPPECDPDPVDPPPFTPPANGFTWKMPQRFTGSVASFHWDQATATYDPGWVHPSEWQADFYACPTQEEESASRAGTPTANTYTWLVREETIAKQSCLFSYGHFPDQGHYDVQLTISGPNASGPFTQQITIRDILIVSLGDSYASGEGNPDKPRDGDAPAEWVDRRCHRSAAAGPAQAAAGRERFDPHTSVTFLSFACSGATISRLYFEPKPPKEGHLFPEFYTEDYARMTGRGILGPYRGVEPPYSDYTIEKMLPSQLDQMVAAVTCTPNPDSCPHGKRRIDALVISGGGNDLGFGPIAGTCLVAWDCTGDHQVNSPYQNNSTMRLTERFEYDASLQPQRYAGLASALRSSGLEIAGTYITEYPDPTTEPDDTPGSHKLCDYMLDDIAWPALSIDAREVEWAAATVMPRLNAEVLAAATAHGWTYVGGIANQFLGHGYCADNAIQRWIVKAEESVVLQGPGDDRGKTTGTLHPNREGNLAYARQITSSIAPQLDLLPPDTGPAETVPPSVTCGSADGAWHAADVVVSCTASDDGSGLADAADAAFSLSTSVPTGTETGDAATGTRSVCDRLGNCATAGPVTGNKVDKAAASLTCASADSTWYAENVSLLCTATDGGSGLVPSDQSFSLTTSVADGTETADAATGTRSVCDGVANCVTAGPLTGNKVDRAAPAVSCAGADGVWHTTDVSVACTASDGGSGLANGDEAAFSLVTAVADGAESSDATTGSRSVCDGAGNCAAAGPVTGNKVDKAAPAVSCATADGLWHGADVSLQCTASDGGSGLADPADAAFSLATAVAAGTETDNAATDARNVCDVSGHCITAGPVSGNRVDKLAPTVTVDAPVAGGAYLLGQAVTAHYGCADSGAGIAQCVGTVADGTAIDTASVGSKTFTVTATDGAGNTTVNTVSYEVRYDFGGFRAPVNPPPALNTMKAGRAVPVKFSLGGDQGLDIFAPGTPQSRTIACSTGAPVSEVEQTVTAGSSNLSYDRATGQYTYLWKTSDTWAGTCRQLVLTLDDGTVHHADFKLT